MMTLTPNPDKDMIALSIGDPTVFGNLKPPEEVISAIVEAATSNSNNGYQPSTGSLEAKKAVAEYVSTKDYAVNAKDVIICSGCSMALDICISVLADRGDNILVPCPGFPLYQTLAHGLGVEARQYNLMATQKWQVDLEHARSLINSRTRAIVVNNPSNPCGSVYSAQHLTDILRLAEEHRIPIIADEIYENFVFSDEEFHYMAALSKNVPILSCGGLTKRFLVPGWRLGWIVIHDRDGAFNKIYRGIQNLCNRVLGANSIVQAALGQILSTTPKSFFSATVQHVENNAALAFEMLSVCPGLHPIRPQGAMYMMIRIEMDRFPTFSSDFHLIDSLVSEQSVFPLPGKCFGVDGFVRIVLTIPRDRMIEACRRIAEFCHQHYVEDSPETDTENNTNQVNGINK